MVNPIDNYVTRLKTKLAKQYFRVAQLVERRSSNSKVAGSRPSRGRLYIYIYAVEAISRIHSKFEFCN